MEITWCVSWGVLCKARSWLLNLMGPFQLSGFYEILKSLQAFFFSEVSLTILHHLLFLL